MDAIPDHVHLWLNILSEFWRCERHFTGLSCWAQESWVSPIGLNEQGIHEYHSPLLSSSGAFEDHPFCR